MVQLLTKGRRKNLLRIPFADRGNGIGEHNAAPHNIYHICQFSNLWIEKTIGRDPSDFKDTVPKNALISEIMYSVNRSSTSKERIVLVQGMHPVGHNTSMPIITMDNIGRPF